MKKQILSILLAAAMTAGMAGCTKEKTGSTMEMPLELSYAGTQLFTDYYEPITFCVTGDWILASQSTDDYKANSIIAYNIETGEMTEPELQNEESLSQGRNVSFWWANATEDGGLMLLCNDYKMTGFDASDIKHYMDYYDADLRFKERVELPADFAPDWSQVSHDYFIMDSQGYSYMQQTDMNGNIYLDVFDQDFRKCGEILLPGTGMQGLFLDTEGRANACVWTYNEKTYESTKGCYVLDGAALSYEQHTSTIPSDETPFFANGTGDYSFYYTHYTGIFGMKADGTSEKVLDWVNSDFSKGSVYRIFALPDGRFLAYTHSNIPQYPRAETWLLRPRTEEEIENMQFISLSGLNLGSELEAAVIQYNRSSTENRIILRDYAEYNENYDDKTGYEMFKKDMLDGIVADIICTDGLPFFSLSNKGLFADLYTFMEADENFHEEDYLMNFFASLENGGRLERIAFSYSVLTAAAKTEHVGTEQGISMEEYLALAEAHPASSTLMTPMDKNMVLYNFLGAMQNCFIDTDTMTCSFDSPDFVRMLELIKKIAEEGEQIMGSQNGHEAYWNAHPFPYRDDAALIDPLYIFQPIRLHEKLVTDFGSADTTLIGYPLAGAESNGGMFAPTFTLSMNSQSLYQEEIWEFMQYLLGDEYQKKSNIAVKRSALEEQLKAAQHMPMATGGSASESEMELLREYIDGIRVCYFQDETVYNILCEEAEMYLAGDCTAEEAAEMMQNRVNIYLSEQG